MALGQILREARIKRGYSESVVAERIKMNPQMIVDIEAEDYSRIAAAIYGKGYVRKYAEFLGIDYRPLVEEFKSTYSSDKKETVAVPLEGYDPKEHTFNKVEPEQSVASSSTQEDASSTKTVEQPTQSTQSVTSENSLFSEFAEPKASPETPEKKEEVFVPAHLATNPPTPTFPPPNAVPDSVAQSRYTFSPEKFTPRTNVFKPEQLASASAPEPKELNVEPFVFPEPAALDDSDDEEIISVSSIKDDESNQSPKMNKPILTRYSGQTKNVEPESVAEDNKKSTPDKTNSFFKSLTAKVVGFFKEVFDNSPEEDVTKLLKRKQRKLGFYFCVVAIVFLVIAFATNGSEASNQAEVPDAQPQENIPELIDDKNPEITVVPDSMVEVQQILQTPKGFID